MAYFDAQKRLQLQRAKAVVLCANGAETPRLLLNSRSSRFPDGLANSSGVVGKHLMFNTYFGVNAQFEHPLNEYKSVQNTRIVLDFYDTDPKRGFYGGGGIDARFGKYPIMFALGGLPPGSPAWGEGFARELAEQFTRTMFFGAHGTSLPLETNSITLDPSLKDAWGLPCMRVTYKDHPDDLKCARVPLARRAIEIAQAAGALKTWPEPIRPQTQSVHLLGTCRMGNDPHTSVVDRFNRTHDVRNLFICDGSSMVTSSRGQPTRRSRRWRSGRASTSRRSRSAARSDASPCSSRRTTNRATRVAGVPVTRPGVARQDQRVELPRRSPSGRCSGRPEPQSRGGAVKKSVLARPSLEGLRCGLKIVLDSMLYCITYYLNCDLFWLNPLPIPRWTSGRSSFARAAWSWPFWLPLARKTLRPGNSAPA